MIRRNRRESRTVWNSWGTIIIILWGENGNEERWDFRGEEEGTQNVWRENENWIIKMCLSSSARQPFPSKISFFQASIVLESGITAFNAQSRLLKLFLVKEKQQRTMLANYNELLQVGTEKRIFKPNESNKIKCGWSVRLSYHHKLERMNHF